MKVKCINGITGILLFVWATVPARACPVCERNRSPVLNGLTHGVGPETRWDYLIVWITVAIALFTLFFSIRWIIHPGEKSDTHIKRVILNNQ